MSKANNKYKNSPQRMVVNGRHVELGSVEEILCHCDWSWHRYLEKLVNFPEAPNPFLSFTEPEILKGLKDRGYISITRDELLAKRDEYLARLEKGQEPYSDKLHPPAEWSESTVNGPVSVLINRETGDWMQLPAAE
tara:strand:+ start:229 stop:636 length:408 start_codon:yes stop_codon:yes gene_type:complete